MRAKRDNRSVNNRQIKTLLTKRKITHVEAALHIVEGLTSNSRFLDDVANLFVVSLTGLGVAGAGGGHGLAGLWI